MVMVMTMVMVMVMVIVMASRMQPGNTALLAEVWIGAAKGMRNATPLICLKQASDQWKPIALQK
eukprot:11360002-Karenia_brevis.AAC.1